MAIVIQLRSNEKKMGTVTVTIVILQQVWFIINVTENR